jgi:hypothetical protein
LSLLIGIRARDGVVVASDGVATSEVLGVPYLRTKINGKLRHGPRWIVTHAGSLGLLQRVHELVERVATVGLPVAGRIDGLTRPLHAASASDVMTWFRGGLFHLISAEVEAGRAAATWLGNLKPSAAFNTETLLAVALADGPHLFHFGYDAAPMEIDDDFPIVACGAGQLLCLPFLLFLRRAMWGGRQPTVEEALLATAWAIDHTLELTPDGLDWPLTIVVMQREKGKGWHTRPIPDDEIERLTEQARAIEQALPELVRSVIENPGATTE